MDRTLQALKRRLEREELELLRQHVIELAGKIDELELRLDQTIRESQESDSAAEFWRESFMTLQESMLDDEHAIGLTKDGQIGIVTKN